MPLSDLPPQRFSVDPDEGSIRLDVFLGGKLNLGRTQVRRLLESGAIRIAGRRVGADAKGTFLPAGCVVEVDPFKPPSSAEVIPQAQMPLTVLAQGPGWIVVDKPAGAPVHPLRADERGTVLNAAIARYPQIQGVGEGGLRSGVVHRLDVDTSGTLLLATDEPTWQGLRRAFSEHRIQKIYRAIVLGPLRGEGRETLDLVIAQHAPARVRVLPAARGAGAGARAGAGGRRTAAARRCDLAWRALEVFESATLVEVSLGTGFLHQIRAIFAHLGHPLAGDRLYNDRLVPDPTMAPRQMLHARRLALGTVSAESPDPADFRAALQRLRSGA